MPDDTAQYPLPQTSSLTPIQNDDYITVKKRKLTSDVNIQDLAYFKTLVLVEQLRPCFIQVLQTPDFRNCEGAYQIRKGMKLVMDLYKKMQIDGSPTQNLENISASELQLGVKKPKKCKKEHWKEPNDGGNQIENRQSQPFPEEKLPHHSFSSVENVEDVEARGSYVVGGSVSGWNFITFVNRNPPAYYGATRNSYPRCRSK